MKRFLQWFIALLQILFGLAFIAVVGLYIFDKFDIDKLKSEEYLKYIAYACAGLYAVLSLIVMVIVLKQRGQANIFTVNGGGVKTKIPGGKVRKLFKKAAASVSGVSLKKSFIEASTAGYTLKLKINIDGRAAKEASDEFKGVLTKLCAEVYGLAFADVEIVVAKVINDADAEAAKKEVQAGMAAEKAEKAEQPETEAAVPYYAQPAENYAYNAPVQDVAQQAEEAPQVEAADTTAATATVYIPEPAPAREPIIKTATAPKAGTAKPRASAAKTSTASSAKAKTTASAAKGTAAKTAAAKKTVKVDPNDPPPFKL